MAKLGLSTCITHAAAIAECISRLTRQSVRPSVQLENRRRRKKNLCEHSPEQEQPMWLQYYEVTWCVRRGQTEPVTWLRTIAECRDADTEQFIVVWLLWRRVVQLLSIITQWCFWWRRHSAWFNVHVHSPAVQCHTGIDASSYCIVCTEPIRASKACTKRQKWTELKWTDPPVLSSFSGRLVHSLSTQLNWTEISV